jgi:hypothetical protein
VSTQRIVELELWSMPGSAGAPFDGKAIAHECRQDLGLSSEVVLGLSFVPNQTDVERFRWRLTNGESSTEQFQAYCVARGIPAQLGALPSVAEYVAHVEGQPLAWLHLPAELDGFPQAKKVLRWALSKGFMVVQAQRPESPLAEESLRALWHQ